MKIKDRFLKNVVATSVRNGPLYLQYAKSYVNRECFFFNV